MIATVVDADEPRPAATGGAPRTTKCSPARITFPGARATAGEGSLREGEESSLLERSSGVAYDRALVSGYVSTGLIGEQISTSRSVELCCMDHRCYGTISAS